MIVHWYEDQEQVDQEILEGLSKNGLAIPVSGDYDGGVDKMKACAEKYPLILRFSNKTNPNGDVFIEFRPGVFSILKKIPMQNWFVVYFLYKTYFCALSSI